MRLRTTLRATPSLPARGRVRRRRAGPAALPLLAELHHLVRRVGPAVQRPGQRTTASCRPLDHAVAVPPLFVWRCGSSAPRSAIAYSVAVRAFRWELPAASADTPPGPAVPVPPAALTFVGLVAVSTPTLLGCNVKPYIFDALIGTGLIYFYLATQVGCCPGDSPCSRLAPPLMMSRTPRCSCTAGSA